MTTARIELPKKLIPVFDGPADVRGAYGGRGSAKTRSFAKMAAVRGYMFGAAGITGQILCARQFMNSLDDSSLEECKRAIESEKWLLEYYDIGEKYIKSKDGRIWFSFAGLDRSINSIKSKGRILICWVDEAEPVSDSAWSILIPTLREEGDDWNAELWVTWNPARKTASVESRFRNIKDPLIKVVELNWRDNPKFPDKLERERVRDLEERPDQYAHIWEGDYITAQAGAYYAKHLAKAREEKRICRIGRDPLMKCWAFFDIGGSGAKADACAIWIVQFIGKEVRFIDYYEAQGQELSAHVAWLRSHDYESAEIVLPHDGRQTDKVYTVSYESEFRKAGFSVRVIDNQGAGAAIARVEASRKLFPQMWFDAEKCSAGLDAIGWYHEKIDEKRGIGLGPDHDWSSHACLVAGSMVTTSIGDRPIESVMVGDMVLTPSGYAIVDNAGISKISVELIEIKLNDGREIIVTPEHKIFTTEGVLCADEISYNNGIITIKDLPCIQLANAEQTGYRDAFIENTKASSIGFGKKEGFIAHKKAANRNSFIGKLFVCHQKILSRFRLMGIGKIFHQIIGLLEIKTLGESKKSFISRKSLTASSITENLMVITNPSLLGMAEGSCTGLYGSSIMELYQQGFMYTTKTATDQITELKTLNVLGSQTTYLSMLKEMTGLVVKKIGSSLSLLGKRQKNGTEATLEKNGTEIMQKSRLLRGKKQLSNASNAGKNTQQNGLENLSIAMSIASKRRYTKKVPVYDLTVRHHHCYFANGILVSNSDAFGMVAVSHDIINASKIQRKARSKHWMG